MHVWLCLSLSYGFLHFGYVPSFEFQMIFRFRRTLVINSFLFTRRRLLLGSRKLVLNKILVRERLYIFSFEFCSLLILLKQINILYRIKISVSRTCAIKRKRCSILVYFPIVSHFLVVKIENWLDVFLSLRKKRVESTKTRKRERHKTSTLRKIIIGFDDQSADGSGKMPATRL